MSELKHTTRLTSAMQSQYFVQGAGAFLEPSNRIMQGNNQKEEMLLNGQLYKRDPEDYFIDHMYGLGSSQKRATSAPNLTVTRPRSATRASQVSRASRASSRCSTTRGASIVERAPQQHAHIDFSDILREWSKVHPEQAPPRRKSRAKDDSSKKKRVLKALPNPWCSPVTMPSSSNLFTPDVCYRAAALGL